MQMITPDMIDEKLAIRIDGELWPNPSHGSNEEFVSMVLAWLANNPIEPTPEKAAKLKDFKHDISELLMEWQRIAYLKKEEPLPEELRNLIEELKSVNLSPSEMPFLIQGAIVSAFKMGKESK